MLTRPRRRKTVLAMSLTLCLLPLMSFAAPPKAYLYVVQHVDLNGVGVELVVPIEEPGLNNSSVSLRPSKAFAALKARSPKAYGSSTLRVKSASEAILVVDTNAEGDRVIAETYWTLASMGITSLTAPPFIQQNVKPSDLQYGAHVVMLSVADVLLFANRSEIPAKAFVMVGDQPVPAEQVARGIATGAKKLGGPKLRDHLAKLIASGSPRGKRQMIRALSKPTVRKTYKLKINLLVPALQDTDLSVRSAALDACISGEVKGNRPVISALQTLVEKDSNTDLKLRAVKALSKAGVNKFDDILQAEKLRTGTVTEALKAVEVLGKSSQVKVAAAALVGALSHRDAGVRNAAFKGLVTMTQWEMLYAALPKESLNGEMKEQIAKVLAQKGNEVAREASLKYLIEKGSADGAIFAAQTYGKLGAMSATNLLIAALKHESPQVREASANALGLIKDERALMPLADRAQASSRDEPYMMKAAETILKTLSLSQVKRFAKSKNLTVRRMAIRSLAGFAQGARPNPSVVALLMESLKDSDKTIKQAAVYALSDIKDDGIARDLSKLHKDADKKVKIRVAHALANASVKYAEAGTLLETMAKDRDMDVRVAAIDGIAKRKHQPAFANLVRLVNYPKPKIQRAVFSALLALRNDQNAQALRMKFRRGMTVRNSAVRLVCVEALSTDTVVGDIDALRQARFDSSKDVQTAAIAALGSSNLPEAMEVLAGWFDDADLKIRELALVNFGKIKVGESWKDKRKRYLRDFMAAPGQQKALVDKAKSLM